jgi:hypothetical protein
VGAEEWKRVDGGGLGGRAEGERMWSVGREEEWRVEGKIIQSLSVTVVIYNPRSTAEH